MMAIMRSNPTRKTLLKVTMSMMATMTTVLHRDFENDWTCSPFSTVQVACLQGVISFSRCCRFLHDWSARPWNDLCSDAFLKVSFRSFQRHSVKFVHIRVSFSCMRFFDSLVCEAALHDRSAIVLRREI